MKKETKTNIETDTPPIIIENVNVTVDDRQKIDEQIKKYKFLKRYRKELEIFHSELSDSNRIVNLHYSLFREPIDEIQNKLSTVEHTLILQSKDAKQLHRRKQNRMFGIIFYIIAQIAILSVSTYLSIHGTIKGGSDTSSIAIVLTTWMQAFFIFTIPYNLYTSSFAQFVQIVNAYMEHYTKFELFKTVIEIKEWLIKDMKLTDEKISKLSKAKLIELINKRK